MSYTVRIPATAKANALELLRSAEPALDDQDVEVAQRQFHVVLDALPALVEQVGGPDDEVTIEVIGHADLHDLARHQADEVIYIAIRTVRPLLLPEEYDELLARSTPKA